MYELGRVYFFMPWGSLYVLCGLWAFVLPLTALWFLSWLCIAPVPYHGHTRISHWAQPLLPGHPIPSSWSNGCSVGAPREGECWSVISCPQLLVGSSGNSMCLMCSCAVGWKSWSLWKSRGSLFLIFQNLITNIYFFCCCCDLIGSFFNLLQLINIKWCKTDCLCRVLQYRRLFPTGFTLNSTALWGWIVWFI